MQVLPFHGQPGAQVQYGGDVHALNEGAFKRLHGAFLDYFVLRIRSQSLDNDKRVGRLGGPAAAAPVHVKPHPQAA